jgi:ribosomal protein L7/L12
MVDEQILQDAMAMRQRGASLDDVALALARSGMPNLDAIKVLRRVGNLGLNDAKRLLEGAGRHLQERRY